MSKLPKKTLKNPPAFPTEFSEDGGLTMLDYFAGIVLPIFIDRGSQPEEAAMKAYDYAKQMLVERDKDGILQEG